MPTARIVDLALRFAYDGTRFRGFARQPGGGTIEDAVLPALAQEGLVQGSWRPGSRTDKGVSALENVAKCRIKRPSLDGLVPAVQSKLPAGVWLTGVGKVDPDWNPRHATSRTYRYFLPIGDESHSKMQTAARAFEGEHNMSAFARVEDRDPVRRIDRFEVYPGEGFWTFSVTAPNFLWNQVRRMVGAVVAVGTGDAKLAEIKAALAGDGEAPGKRMPGAGLVLDQVRYKPQLKWRQIRVVWKSKGEALGAWRAQDALYRHLGTLDG